VIIAAIRREDIRGLFRGYILELVVELGGVPLSVTPCLVVSFLLLPISLSWRWKRLFLFVLIYGGRLDRLLSLFHGLLKNGTSIISSPISIVASEEFLALVLGS
jgi:hypothetical protein